MTLANKEQIASIRDCLNLMNQGNFESLKEMALETLERLEVQLKEPDIRNHLQIIENKN